MHLRHHLKMIDDSTMLTRDEEVQIVEFFSSLDHDTFRNVLFNSTGLDTGILGDGSQSTETWAVALTKKLKRDSRTLVLVGTYIVENFPSVPQIPMIRSMCSRMSEIQSAYPAARVRDLDLKLEYIAQFILSSDVIGGALDFSECRSFPAFQRFFHLLPSDVDAFGSEDERDFFALPIAVEQALFLRFGLAPTQSPSFNLQEKLDDHNLWSRWVMSDFPSWRAASLSDFSEEFDDRLRHSTTIDRFREIDDPQLTRARDQSLSALSKARSKRRDGRDEGHRAFRALKNQKNPLRDVVMIGASVASNSPAGSTIILLEFQGKITDVVYSGMKFEVSINNCVVEIVAKEAYAGSPILGISPFGDIESVTKNNGKIVVEWDGVKGDPSWRISSAETAILGWFEDEFCTLVGRLFEGDRISLRIMRADINVNPIRGDIDLSDQKSKVLENIVRRAVSEDADGVIISEIDLRDGSNDY